MKFDQRDCAVRQKRVNLAVNACLSYSLVHVKRHCTTVNLHQVSHTNTVTEKFALSCDSRWQLIMKVGLKSFNESGIRACEVGLSAAFCDQNQKLLDSDVLVLCKHG